MQAIANENFLWKSLYQRDFCPPYQESENYKLQYKIVLTCASVIYIKACLGQPKKISYNDKTTVLDMKSFIFKHWITQPGSAPNHIRLYWTLDPINSRGTLLRDKPLVKDYKIPNGTVLGIDLAGFAIKL
jgi:hypothetical protein